MEPTNVLTLSLSCSVSSLKTNDGLVNDGQPPAKRRRRASFAASSVRPGEVWTPLSVASPHDAGLYTHLNREGVLDDHEWHTQRIVGE
jgi:hypothetical protein